MKTPIISAFALFPVLAALGCAGSAAEPRYATAVPDMVATEWKKDCGAPPVPEQPLLCTYRNERLGMNAFVTRDRSGESNPSEAGLQLMNNRVRRGYSLHCLEYKSDGTLFCTESEGQDGVTVSNIVVTRAAALTGKPFVVTVGWRECKDEPEQCIASAMLLATTVEVTPQ